jgi:5-formyltetrahydrofolate cyclo-ligase
MKNLIRRKLLARKKKDRGSGTAGKDLEIRNRLFSMPEFRKARIVLFYVSMKGEVKTEKAISEALRMGKRVLVPFVSLKRGKLLIAEINDLHDISPGAFGIPTPKHPKEFPLDKIDLIIVPGIAFDKKGNRVSYGGGFYDRFLRQLKSGAGLIALAYELQLVPRINPNKTDVRLEKIVTEREIINCGQK